MKKWIYFLLIGMLLLSISACGVKPTASIQEPTNGESTPSTQESTNNETTPVTQVYTNFLNNYTNNAELLYFIKDIDNNGTEELIIHQNTGIEIYTHGDSVKKVGTHDFITGTVQFYHINNKKYPGIVFVTIGGGKEHFGYIAITNGVLTFQQIFDNDFAMISGKKEDVFYTDNEELIALSKKAYQEDCYITYSKH